MANQIKHSTSPKPTSVPASQADRDLDRDLEDTFPASDPVASAQRVTAKPPSRDDRQGKDHGVLPTPTDEQKAQAEQNRRDLDTERGRRH